MRKVYGSSPTRCPDGMLAHCSPSSKWVPGGNTGEIKAARKGTAPPLPHMPMAQDKCPLNKRCPLNKCPLNKYYLYFFYRVRKCYVSKYLVVECNNFGSTFKIAEN